MLQMIFIRSDRFDRVEKEAGFVCVNYRQIVASDTGKWISYPLICRKAII